ncbi:MAG: hypothetical protein WD355_12635 [Balneolaceae bacterium]
MPSTTTRDRIQQNEPAARDLVDKIKNVNLTSSYYLLLLTGPWVNGKRSYLESIAAARGESVTEIDMHDVVTLHEEETYKKIDELFDSLGDDERILYFKNGDRLCGTYTGYTYSSTRYATPQERYLIKKILKLQKIVIIDIVDEDNVDKTLERHSQAIVRFDHSGSLFRRFLGGLSVHGHNITSKRPG